MVDRHKTGTVAGYSYIMISSDALKAQKENIIDYLSNIFDKMLPTVYYAHTGNAGYGASERRS